MPLRVKGFANISTVLMLLVQAVRADDLATKSPPYDVVVYGGTSGGIVAEAIYREMLQEAKVPVVLGERLDLKAGVAKAGARIVSIKLESGLTFLGTMFLGSDGYAIVDAVELLPSEK